MYRFLLLVITALLVVTCTTEDEAIARFGPHTIRLNEFKDAYIQVLKQPDVFDSRSVRERYLNELIDRRLIAEEARSEGMDRDERLLFQVSAYHDKQLREAHFREVIAPRIQVSDADVRQVYAFTKERRKVRHLFVRTKEEAEKLHRRLKDGADWMYLAGEVFDDPEMARNGGDLGWVHWDQMEFDMAMAAFTQEVKTFSAPVPSRFGYHILYVEDFEKELMISESDLDMHMDKTRALIGQKKGERIASGYIENMMKGRNLQIGPAALQRVAGRLTQILTRRPTQFDQMSDMQLTADEISRLEAGVWELRNEALVIVDGKELSVGNFIGMTNYIPYSALHQGMKTALDYAIRDFVITEEAKRMGLDRKYEFIDRKTRLFEEYQLQLALRRKMAASVFLTDSLITAYLNETNRPLTGGMVTEELKERIKQEESRKTVSGYILQLRTKYDIEINTTPMHSYYDSLKRKPE